MTWRFFVEGTPRPAGSKRGFPIKRKNGQWGVALSDSSGQEGRNWRLEVREAGRKERGAARPSSLPISVDFTFFVRRPKAHFTKRGLRPAAPLFPTTKPDVLKLARAVEDALTGVLWNDDSQVFEMRVQKVYVRSGCSVDGDPGVRIIVTDWEETHAQPTEGVRQ